MIQEQRVILKSIGYGEEGSYNNIVAKYHSQGTAWWPIWATHHSQGTARWSITATHHSQGTSAASAASATHAPGAGAAHPAGGVAPAGGVQRSISPQVLTKAWRPPLQCRQWSFHCLGDTNTCGIRYGCTCWVWKKRNGGVSQWVSKKYG